VAAVLASERLVFHTWEEGDFPLLQALHGDCQVQRYIALGGPPWDEAYLRGRLEAFRAGYAMRGFTKFKLLGRDGTFLGRAGFGVYGPTGEVELGYALLPQAWGSGYATEAARALLAWIYDAAPVSHVIASAVAENAPSRRALERAGMQFTGYGDVSGILNAFYRHDAGGVVSIS